MSKLQFVPHILREHLLSPDFEREAEPGLVMDREDQVAGYVDAGGETGGMYAVHLFHAAHITQTIDGARRVLDLACGPATQLLLTASLHPEVAFTGCDLSAPMLEAAQRRARALGLSNVRFEQRDITNLSGIAPGQYDAITSTMALHHLPGVAELERCFAEIARLAPGCVGVYLGDLLRFRRRGTVEFMAQHSADTQPRVFNDDFRNSMLAAFSRRDFNGLRRRYLPFCKGYSAAPLPLFHVVKTEGPALDPKWTPVFVGKRAALPARLRRDLDDLRFFFRLGGLEADPFAP